MFVEQAARYGAKPLFWFKRDGRYQPISWRDAAELVERLAAWLLAQGVQAGDRVVILSENRPEWGITDLAAQSIGAWTVPIYPSLPQPDVLVILKDAEPVACIASTAEQLEKLRQCAPSVPSIRHLVLIDGAGKAGANEIGWAEALRAGSDALRQSAATLDARRRALQPNDTATIIYTSGTTGQPKGAMLSHHNFLSNADACLAVISITDADRHLSFLPLCHVFERMAGWYLMLRAGAEVAYAESMDTLPQNMPEIRPTVMLGVPRFFEKLYARIQEAITHAPANKQRLIHWALRAGERVSLAKQGRCRLNVMDRLMAGFADRLVLRKLRAKLGGRLRFFVSGSAPLSKTIAEFFHSVGVTILEGYGLTETSPVISVNRIERLRFGSVGIPLDGLEVRIAEDGEILTRGPHIMQGYFRKPAETAEALRDGWFHTGDIGDIDQDGFLHITDRKKDLIKTAGGKFVAPQKLENLFVTDPYVSQAFVYGDRERYCVALIVPNLVKLKEHAQAHQLPCASPAELVAQPAIRQFLWERIQARQHDLAGFEQVKAIALLEQEFTQAGGELTPIMQTKLALIAQRYKDLLATLYEQPTAA